MDDFIKKFAKRVKVLRKICGFSQERFAELLEVSPTTVVAIETGRSFVKYQTLKKICDILNVTPRNLFDFDIKDDTKQDKLLKQIIARSKTLTPEQKKQVIEIIKTFEKK